MIIVYYDDKDKQENILATIETIKEATKEPIIAIPKNYDVLLNCSFDQLATLKGIIDTALGLKLSLGAANSTDKELPSIDEETDDFEKNHPNVTFIDSKNIH